MTTKKKKAPATQTAMTDAQRQARYRQKARQLSAALTDEAAIAKLGELTAKHGGVKAAVEFALRTARVR